MNRGTMKRRGALIMCLLLMGAAFAGCGDNDTPQGWTWTAASAPATAPAGLDACVTCHPGPTIDWLASSHANISPDDGLNSVGSPTLGQLTGCTVNCHDPLGDSGKLTLNWTGNVARPVVGCESCHGGGSEHNGSGPIARYGSAASTTGRSAQFNTCTTCHELLNTAGTGTIATTHDSASSVPPTGNQYTITDTHFAKNLISFGANTSIAGYAMDFASEKVCTDCHNPHGKADINNEWAQSAHADRNGTTRGYFAGAWGRNNWSCDGTNLAANCGTTSFTDRRFCQRCHSTTGFAAFADALRTGNTESAREIIQGDRYNISLLTYTTAGWKPEMLKCNGCHTDYKGALRNPGPVTIRYDYYTRSIPLSDPVALSVFTGDIPHTYPDAAGSNICISCHSGRESGETLKGLNDAALLSAGTISAFDFSNKGWITSHFLTGGGTVFTASGYEFAGRSYANNSSYLHDKIGTPATEQLFPNVNTGSNGPCVGCHMSRPNKSGNHLFLPISRSALTGTATVSRATATITGIASEVCFKCHGPNAEVVLDMVKEQKVLYADASEAVVAALEQAGIYKRGSSFYPVRNSQIISAGTVSAVIGSPVITGKTTNWASVGLEPGDRFRVDNDGTWYYIASFASNSITLTAPYNGVSTGLTYTFTTNYTIQKDELVSVATGSTIVTGNKTNWIAAAGLIAPGDRFRIDSDGTWYTIASVDSDTQISLSAPYAGASATTQFFTLRNTTTALVSNGSTTVTVTGADLVTLDVANKSGTTMDYFRIDADETWYSIVSRTSNTLVLSSAYAGASVATPAAYTIIRSGSMRNWLTRGDSDLTGNTTGKNTMGAAFNVYLMESDPGGYAHNRYYMKRLMYDSIDWIDDGVMNYSTGTTINALCSGGTAPSWCAGAITYLLPNGTWPGIASERP